MTFTLSGFMNIIDSHNWWWNISKIESINSRVTNEIHIGMLTKRINLTAATCNLTRVFAIKQGFNSPLTKNEILTHTEINHSTWNSGFFKVLTGSLKDFYPTRKY